MKMFEVQYDFQYSYGEKVTEVEQVTEERLREFEKWNDEGKYMTNLKVLRELGEQDTTWIPTWLSIGMRNPWISKAWDPAFDEKSFAECKTMEYLFQKFRHGNWCLGTAFYYRDLCFINQVNGGDEWLVIRRGVSFESVSCGHILERDGEQALKALLERYHKATDEQLVKLDF